MATIIKIKESPRAEDETMELECPFCGTLIAYGESDVNEWYVVPMPHTWGKAPGLKGRNIKCPFCKHKISVKK